MTGGETPQIDPVTGQEMRNGYLGNEQLEYASDYQMGADF